MKNLISSNGQYEAQRLSKQEVQVSNVKTFKSYIITATASGFTGQCSCAYGQRVGTVCPHMTLVKELVAIEQAPVVVEVKTVGTLQTWLKEQEDDGVIIFI